MNNIHWIWSFWKWKLESDFQGLNLELVFLGLDSWSSCSLDMRLMEITKTITTERRDLWFRNLWFSFFFWATIMVVSCGCPADPTETSTATHDFQRILLDTIKHYDDDSFEAEVSIWLSEKVKNQIHSLAHLRRPFPFSSSENKWVQSLNNITILAIRRVIN